MSTIHIEADKLDIAELVLMPGDPRRCQFIAEKYLKKSKLINERREELGYTGYYKNKRVTIFSSGMGIPSMGIYSYELYAYYDVKAIIRIGTAGSYTEELKIKDLFLVNSSYSESSYEEKVLGKELNIIKSTPSLNTIIKNTAKELNFNIKQGRVYTSEAFYEKEKDYLELKSKHNCDAVEMESFSLFANAEKLHKKASTILTISDSFTSAEKMNPEDREQSLNDMVLLALESIISL